MKIAILKLLLGFLLIGEAHAICSIEFPETTVILDDDADLPAVFEHYNVKKFDVVLTETMFEYVLTIMPTCVHWTTERLDKKRLKVRFELKGD